MAQCILVVDDEESIRRFISSFLKAQGFEVFEAADGEEGVSLVRRLNGHLDLILTDMVMPNRSGTSLIEAALAMYPHLKAICMSAYNPDSVPPEVPFLQKPFQVEALLRVLKPQLGATCHRTDARRVVKAEVHGHGDPTKAA